MMELRRWSAAPQALGAAGAGGQRPRAGCRPGTSARCCGSISATSAAHTSAPHVCSPPTRPPQNTPTYVPTCCPPARRRCPPTSASACPPARAPAAAAVADGPAGAPPGGGLPLILHLLHAASLWAHSRARHPNRAAQVVGSAPHLTTCILHARPPHPCAPRISATAACADGHVPGGTP